MSNAINAINVIESVKFMAEIFGDKEFTAKEWKDRKVSGMSVLDTLTETFYHNGRYQLVKKVRVETFSAEIVDNYGGVSTDFIINAKGDRIMRKRDFDKLPLSVRNMMETANDAPLRVRTYSVKIVEGVRYIYQLNLEALPHYIAKELNEIDYALRETEKAMQKLHEKHDRLVGFKVSLM